MLEKYLNNRFIILYLTPFIIGLLTVFSFQPFNVTLLNFFILIPVLEAFLFYKYPNAIKNDDKLKRFFGDNTQASTIINRINNEFSHLEGLFERSMTPIDIPEMKKTAKFILDKIKEKDNEQYDALLLSIGIEV